LRRSFPPVPPGLPPYRDGHGWRCPLAQIYVLAGSARSSKSGLNYAYIRIPVRMGDAAHRAGRSLNLAVMVWGFRFQVELFPPRDRRGSRLSAVPYNRGISTMRSPSPPTVKTWSKLLRRRPALAPNARAGHRKPEYTASRSTSALRTGGHGLPRLSGCGTRSKHLGPVAHSAFQANLGGAGASRAVQVEVTAGDFVLPVDLGHDAGARSALRRPGCASGAYRRRGPGRRAAALLVRRRRSVSPQESPPPRSGWGVFPDTHTSFRRAPGFRSHSNSPFQSPPGWPVLSPRDGGEGQRGVRRPGFSRASPRPPPATPRTTAVPL